MKIKVHNPADLPTRDYRKFIPLQGELKEFREREFEKLRHSIETFGFRVPVFLWFPADQPDKSIILDGHGRWKLCMKLKVQPYKLPYVRIDAETIDEAKRLLLVITSQMQKITQEGLYEFTLDIDPEFLKAATSFAGVFNFENEDMFTPDYDPAAENGEVNASDIDQSSIAINPGTSPVLELTCPHCGKDFKIANTYGNKV